MTKTDYVLIANRIRTQYDDSRGGNPTSVRIALEELTVDLANDFAKRNPHFNLKRFHVAALGHDRLVAL